MQRGYCKGCGRPVYWVKTKRGKVMPVNTLPARFWYNPYGRYKLMTVTGEIVSCDLTGKGKESGVGYTSHFATCPNAQDYRNRKQ